MPTGEYTISAKATFDVSDFNRGLASFEKGLSSTQDGFSKYGAEAEKATKKSKSFIESNRSHMEALGKDAMLMGTGMLASLGLAAKAAISWESAWAGVRKTTNGSPAEMAALEKELRGLAKTLPATHEEIAGVAEAAGQLGIQRQNVTAFTRTMIDLGESTNLSAEEAATGLARFSNIMGTNQTDAFRLGASLVGLGNNFATTEAEILAMSMRLAGAGKQAGLAEGQVMGLAAGMSSVGIEAEAGGTAMSVTMKRIGKSVDDGDSKLALFARTAGMTSEQFQKAWKSDAAGALESFVLGLGKAGESGESVNAILETLGITGIREADALLRLSSAGELMGNSMRQGGDEFQKGSALAEEAAKRYETTESKIRIAWNGIKDAAIDAGAVLLPALQGVAESVSGLASAFGGLPEPVKGGMVAVVGITGVALLLGGALLTTIPRIYDSVKAMQALAVAAPRTAAALASVGKAATGALALVALTTVLAKIAEGDYMSKIDTGMGNVARALAAVTTNGPKASEALDALFRNKDGGQLVSGVNDLGTALQRTFHPNRDQQFNRWAETLINGATGVKGGTQILEDAFGRVDQVLADMVSSGRAEDAAAAFEHIKQKAAGIGVSVEELTTTFPAYADALKAAEAASITAAAETKNVEGALTAEGKTAVAAAAQTEEIEKALADVGLAANGTITNLALFTDALANAGLINLSARDAARQFEAAIDNLSESIATNGTTLDRTTEQGRANEAALDAIAQAGLRSTQAMAQNKASQGELQGSLKGTYDGLVGAARQFTATDDEAIALARDILKIPPGVSIDSWMDEQAKITAAEIKASVEAIPARKNIAVVLTYSDIGRDEAMARRGQALEGKAHGGRIDSPGFPKGKDSKLIMAAHGEHMWTAREVDAVGGHEAVEALRRMALSGGQAAIRHASTSPSFTLPAVAAAPSGPVAMTGTLVLDSGEIMGTFHGIARAEVENGFREANNDHSRGKAR